MFDKERYQNACAHLNLGQEKREEIITMVENTSAKKRLSRPVKTILIAAACVAALTVTAMAAPAVQQLFLTYTITYVDDSTQTAFTMPTLALEQREDRSILTVDGQETDVTDAFARDGQYVLELDQATLTVKPDGLVEVQMAGGGESGPITYTFNLHEDAPLTGVGNVKIATEDNVDSDAFGSYEVTVDENDGIQVTDYAPAE